MRSRVFVNVAKVPALVATIALTRDSEAFARLGFLRVAVRTGLLEAIGDGASFAALVDRMDVVAADLLDGLLRLGVALGELGGSPSRYTVKGRRARAIASPKGDALQALLLEIVEYHGSVYDQLPDRLRGAPVGDYLASTAGTGGSIIEDGRTIHRGVRARHGPRPASRHPLGDRLWHRRLPTPRSQGCSGAELRCHRHGPGGRRTRSKECDVVGAGGPSVCTER